jgi:hypothetical protein
MWIPERKIKTPSLILHFILYHSLFISHNIHSPDNTTHQKNNNQNFMLDNIIIIYIKKEPGLVLSLFFKRGISVSNISSS